MNNESSNQRESATHYIRPVWSAPEQVSVFTTTRSGGVSIGPYASMNLGLHVGDAPDAVLENRHRLLQEINPGSAPFWLNQTHSNTVVSVDDNAGSNDGDGAYTGKTGIVLTVLTADCLPVVLTNQAGSELAVVHAGWRGLANGIIGNAIACFENRTDIHAWLGPAIGPAAFEVGEDVKLVFTERCESHKQFFKPGLTLNKYWCDLYGLARAQLRELGCQRISGGDFCTYSQSEIFHSHRRDGIPSGRMATLAWINPGVS